MARVSGYSEVVKYNGEEIFLWYSINFDGVTVREVHEAEYDDFSDIYDYERGKGFIVNEYYFNWATVTLPNGRKVRLDYEEYLELRSQRLPDKCIKKLA